MTAMTPRHYPLRHLLSFPALLICYTVFCGDFATAAAEDKAPRESQKVGYVGDPAVNRVLTEAYRNSPELQAALRQYYATVEEIPSARAAFLPNIAVSGTGRASKNFSDQIGKTQIPDARSSNDTSEQNYSIGAQISQNLFRGFRDFNGLRGAELSVLAAQQRFVEAEQSVLLKAVQAYLDVWRAMETLKSRRASEKFTERTLKQVQAQSNVGASTRTEVAEAKANLAGAVADRIVAEGALGAAKAAYEEVVGAPAPDRIERPTFEFAYAELPKTFELLEELSKRQNPAIIGAQFAARARERAAAAGEGALAPSLDLAVNGSRSRNKNHGTAIGANFAEQKSRRHAYTSQGSAELKLTVPIYQSGGEWSQIRRGHQEYYQSRKVLAQRRREIMRQVADKWHAWRDYARTIEQQETRVRSAQLALEGRRQEYLVGERTLTDVFESERVVSNAQVDLATAIRNYYVSGFEVMSVAGMLLPQTLGLKIDRYDFVNYTQAQAGRIFGKGDLRRPEDIEQPSFFNTSKGNGDN